MSLLRAVIVEPDTDVFEGVINHKSLHLKHMNSVKIPGNFSASKIFMSLIWALIVELDTIFSESDIDQTSFCLKQLHGCIDSR